MFATLNITTIALMIVIGIVILGIGILIGYILRKRVSEKKILSAERRVKEIIKDAEIQAENIKKASSLEAKEKLIQAKEQVEKKLREKRDELKELEKRLYAKELHLDKKTDKLEEKEERLEKRKEKLEEIKRLLRDKKYELRDLINRETTKLEEISKMTRDEAKQELIELLRAKAEQEAAKIAHKIRNKAIEGANKEAKNIIALAINRCSPDYTIENTVSIVDLPSDEMKGRIIGREGRNIRVLEKITGVDLIIDDTPESVVISSFNPIRREIARISLEKLIKDGRIHPARIEEIVKKVKEDLDEKIMEIGENAIIELGISNINKNIIKLLGKLHYRTSYSQNVLMHSKEVAYLAGIMASELGLSFKLSRRMGLLHDIGKAVDHEVEGNHAEIGANLARRYNESETVVNAIESHHEAVEPTSPEAILIAAADAISASRPGVRRETLEGYIQRLERLESLSSSFDGVEKAYAIQAGREIRVIVQSDDIDDIQAGELSHKIAKKIEEEEEFPGEIKVVVIREVRSIDYAK
jgi:ribonuclease Y